MPYELKIALRFLLRSKTQTVFILFGIALGVAVQIFLGNLIASLQSSLIESTIGTSPHIIISREEDTITRLLDSSSTLYRGNYPVLLKNLENWKPIETSISSDPRITIISPALDGTAILNNGGKSVPVLIKGVDPAKADRLYNIAARMVSGNMVIEGNSVLIGKSLAEDLSKYEGDSISLLLPGGSLVQVIISGVFDLQNENSNSALIFMDLSHAQTLYGSKNGISSLEIQVQDPFIADQIAKDLEYEFAGISVQNWKAQNSQLLIALTSQSSSSYTIQFFVIIAVTFGIASVLAVSVIQKSRQIGILKAMGATKKSAARIFICEGFILGLAGSLIGSVVGILMLMVFGSANQTFSITVEPLSVLSIICISVAAGTLSSLIPARSSAELNPMEAIRNG